MNIAHIKCKEPWSITVLFVSLYERDFTPNILSIIWLLAKEQHILSFEHFYYVYLTKSIEFLLLLFLLLLLLLLLLLFLSSCFNTLMDWLRCRTIMDELTLYESSLPELCAKRRNSHNSSSVSLIPPNKLWQYNILTPILSCMKSKTKTIRNILNISR